MSSDDAIQDHRARPFWWASNLLVDKYLRLLTLEAFAVYCTLARFETIGSGHVEGDVRRMIVERVPLTAAEMSAAFSELERWRLIRFTWRDGVPDRTPAAYDMLDMDGEEGQG